MNKKLILILIIAVSIVSVYFIMYNNSKVPYSISEENVKSIYCDDYSERKVIPVNDSDKKIIIAEVSKMRETETPGQLGTPMYEFVIELTDGHKIKFIQNTRDVIEINSDIDYKQRKIKAPKTRKFITRFIEENNLPR